MFGTFGANCLHCGNAYISGDCITNCCHDCCLQGHAPGSFPWDCPACEKSDSDRWKQMASDLAHENESLKEQIRAKDDRISELLRTRVPKYKRGLRS
jgi:hypothetical protein